MPRTVEEEARRLFGADRDQLEQLARRFAEPREKAIKLLAQIERAQGHALGAELRTWVRLFERYEMEVADPGYAELRAPEALLSLSGLIERRESPSWLADVLGFFCAATVVIQQDEMSYLASLCADESGACRVHYFHPHDWGLWPTDSSLAARLYRLLQEDDRESALLGPFTGEEAVHTAEALEAFEHLFEGRALPPHLDPARLVFRVNWLIHALLGVGTDLGRALMQAPPFDVFERERALVSSWPHIAAYWLWAHYFLDNREELEWTMAQAEAHQNEVVQESLQTIKALLAGQKVKLGEQSDELLRSFQDALVTQAPAPLFGPGAQSRQRVAREAKRSSKEQETLTELSAVADDEPLVKEALFLLEHLSRGGALPPPPVDLHGGLNVDQSMDRLAELVDERFRPLILLRLRRAAQHGDTHQEASWGLLLAWAHLADGLDGFEAAIGRIGTENLGPRRRTELYRAYAYFDDPRATDVLAHGARSWLDQIDDWIRMAPAEPVLQLMKRDSLQTHEVIAAILERASFSGANWEIALKAAICAGALKSKRAIPGLKRAIKRGLGRLEDHSRVRVVQALYFADGDNNALFLKGLLEARLTRMRRADLEDRPVHLKEVACLLSGLLPMAPESEQIIKTARRLLKRFYEQLGEPRGVRTTAIAAAHAIVSGAQLGQVRPLIDAISPYAQLVVHKSAPARQSALELKMLASKVKRELS